MTPPEPLAPQAAAASSNEDATDGTQDTWTDNLDPELLSLNESGMPTFPKEWYDDPDDENKSMKAFLRYNVDLTFNPANGPVWRPPITRVTRDNLETEYISLVRRVPSTSKAMFYRSVDGKQVGIELATVPKAKVASLEAQGWEV
ncbi:unnamed protein product [Clonostachys rosea f. rosea IK726]|uniref:Uncharacterized protein n=1 Tax=Clonostachys rosea f. rosea IK726 TaxID=1349383 RepID=A0ACA9UEU6_BIOOC|nr:unnamed protein product [Clonostachys rosea f. rosea IK726]